MVIENDKGTTQVSTYWKNHAKFPTHQTAHDCQASFLTH